MMPDFAFSRDVIDVLQYIIYYNNNDHIIRKIIKELNEKVEWTSSQNTTIFVICG